jgi:hypothetical protein
MSPFARTADRRLPPRNARDLLAPSARALLTRAVAVVAIAAFLVGCGPAGAGQTNAASATAHASSPLASVPRGEAVRAERVVHGLARALHDGDVERLCRPGAIFTPAVVGLLDRLGNGCEASLELSSALRRPPELSVTGLTAEPDLVTAQVRLGRGPTIPLDLVRDGRRWLVSFCDGASPIAALQERVGKS